MKKILLVLLLLLCMGVTYAYMMTTVNSNELTIVVSTPDAGNAVLVDLQKGYLLVPRDAIVTKTNETKTFEYHLTVQDSVVRQYTITHNLPDAYSFTHNNTSTTFTTGSTYTITIQLNEPVTITNQTFFITVTYV